jgi:excisionase family DNA binding protein
MAVAAEEKLAYSIKDSAAALGISRSKLYTMISAKEIRAVKIGSRTIITTDELKRFLSSLENRPEITEEHLLHTQGDADRPPVRNHDNPTRVHGKKVRE